MNALLQEGLIATKHIQHAAIIKRKDGIIKAKSTSFSISPNELAVIEQGFEKPSEIRAPNTIFPFMDIPFKAIRADKLSIYAKHEKCGVIVARTNHHYIVGTFDSTMYASVAVESVEKLAEYLRKKDK